MYSHTCCIYIYIQILYLVSWIEGLSMLEILPDEFPKGLQIVEVNIMIRDGFLMLLYPLMRFVSKHKLVLYTRLSSTLSKSNTVASTTTTTSTTNTVDELYDIRIKVLNEYNSYYHPLVKDTSRMTSQGQGQEADYGNIKLTADGRVYSSSMDGSGSGTRFVSNSISNVMSLVNITQQSIASLLYLNKYGGTNSVSNGITNDPGDSSSSSSSSGIPSTGVDTVSGQDRAHSSDRSPSTGGVSNNNNIPTGLSKWTSYLTNMLPTAIANQLPPILPTTNSTAGAEMPTSTVNTSLSTDSMNAFTSNVADAPPPPSTVITASINTQHHVNEKLVGTPPPYSSSSDIHLPVSDTIKPIDTICPYGRGGKYTFHM